ncbi:TPA: restriction endonuclease subunit S [Streptococcus suis]|nr:restriction endonuclease subunit S [Streptococcus suis]
MKTNNNIPAYRFQGYTDAWELRKLGELAEIVRGASPRPIQDPKWFDEQSEIGWLRISDVTEQDGRIYHLEQKISKLGQQKTRVLVEPHLLLSIAATVGKPVVNYVKTGVHDGFLIFLEPRFEQEFMFQWLEMFRSSWSKYGQPGSQVNLNSDLVKNQELSIPTHPEQEAIGTFFSTLDRHITLHQRKLDTLKEQKKTYLKLLFPAKGQTKPALRFQGFEDDWVEVKLGEVCTIQGGNAWKSDSYSLTGEYLVVTIANVTGEYFIDDKKGNRIDINPNEMQYVLKKGDILISLTGNVGRVSKMTESKGVLNQRVGKLTTTANFEFIFSILRTEKFENEMRLASQGAAQANISNKDVLQYMIPLPTHPEQETIGTFFQTLDQEIAQVEDKLASLKEMKKTLLRKLFV